MCQHSSQELKPRHVEKVRVEKLNNEPSYLKHVFDILSSLRQDDNLGIPNSCGISYLHEHIKCGVMEAKEELRNEYENVDVLFSTTTSQHDSLYNRFVRAYVKSKYATNILILKELEIHFVREEIIRIWGTWSNRRLAVSRKIFLFQI